jgi:GTP-binding protein
LIDVYCGRYAKAPTAIRTDWNEFTKDYFLNRKTLVCVLLLVDSSIPPQQIDLDCVDWLGRNKVKDSFSSSDGSRSSRYWGLVCDLVAFVVALVT